MQFDFGPVITAEMITSSRRPRHFAVRVLFVSLFFAVLSIQYGTFSNRFGASNLDDQSRFGRQFVGAFLTTQLYGLLFLTPAYVAPCIAYEKERRTLSFLFATDLRDYEIVLSKWGVRVLHLLLYLFSTVPVLLVVTWFGGASPNLVLQSYLLTLMTVMGFSGISMLCSVYALRVRNAVTRTYASLFLFLLIPLIVGGVMELWGLPSGRTFEVLRPLLYANPFWVHFQLNESEWSAAQTGWMVSFWSSLFQFLVMGICLFWSIYCLRRVYVRQLSEPLGDFNQTNREKPDFKNQSAGLWKYLYLQLVILPRPPVMTYPVFWKEVFTGEHRQRFHIWRVLESILGLWFPALVLAGAYLSQSGDDFIEMAQVMIRLLLTGTAMVSLLQISIRSATNISVEREQQTWDHLLVSTLPTNELIWSKVLGTISAAKRTLMMAGIWMTLGIISGAVRLEAAFLFIVAMGSYCLFMSSVGVSFGLRFQRGAVALAMTIGALFFCAGGYMIFGFLLPLFSVGVNASEAILGPSFLAVLGGTPFYDPSSSNFLFWNQGWFTSSAFFFLMVYLITAWVLVGSCIRMLSRTRQINRQPKLFKVLTTDN